MVLSLFYYKGESVYSVLCYKNLIGQGTEMMELGSYSQHKIKLDSFCGGDGIYTCVYGLIFLRQWPIFVEKYLTTIWCPSGWLSVGKGTRQETKWLEFNLEVSWSKERIDPSKLCPLTSTCLSGHVQVWVYTQGDKHKIGK